MDYLDFNETERKVIINSTQQLREVNVLPHRFILNRRNMLQRLRVLSRIMGRIAFKKLDVNAV